MNSKQIVERGYGNHHTFVSPIKRSLKETPIKLATYASVSAKKQLHDSASLPEYSTAHKTPPQISVEESLTPQLYLFEDSDMKNSASKLSLGHQEGLPVVVNSPRRQLFGSSSKVPMKSSEQNLSIFQSPICVSSSAFSSTLPDQKGTMYDCYSNTHSENRFDCDLKDISENGIQLREKNSNILSEDDRMEDSISSVAPFSIPKATLQDRLIPNRSEQHDCE